MSALLNLFRRKHVDNDELLLKDVNNVVNQLTELMRHLENRISMRDRLKKVKISEKLKKDGKKLGSKLKAREDLVEKVRAEKKKLTDAERLNYEYQQELEGIMGSYESPELLKERLMNTKKRRLGVYKITAQLQKQISSHKRKAQKCARYQELIEFTSKDISEEIGCHRRLVEDLDFLKKENRFMEHIMLNRKLKKHHRDMMFKENKALIKRLRGAGCTLLNTKRCIKRCRKMAFLVYTFGKENEIYFNRYKDFRMRTGVDLDEIDPAEMEDLDLSMSEESEEEEVNAYGKQGFQSQWTLDTEAAKNSSKTEWPWFSDKKPKTKHFLEPQIWD